MSTLPAEQRRELAKAEDEELNTFVKYSLVDAASRQGISVFALMKMRSVVTLEDDGQLKARLVVQGFTGQRLGKIPTSSPVASRRSRQNFLTLAASRGFQTHKGDAGCACPHGGRATRGRPRRGGFQNCVSATSFRHVLRTSPRNVSKVAVGASPVCSLAGSRVRLGQRSKKMVSPSCHGGEESLYGTLLVDFETKMFSFRPCAWCMLMISCWRAVTPHWENVSLTTATICMNGELGSHACSHQFHRTRERSLTHQLAITSTTRQRIPNHST